MGGNLLKSNGVEAPPRANANLSNLRTQQFNTAGEFRNNIPGMAEEQTAHAADTGRRELAANLAGNKEGASRRGLLYSGLKQGADLDAHSAYAAGLASKRASINADLEDKATQMEDAAIGGAFDDQKTQQSAYDQAFQQRQARNASRNQAIGQLGGGLGSLAGGLLGSG